MSNGAAKCGGGIRHVDAPVRKEVLHSGLLSYTINAGKYEKILGILTELQPIKNPYPLLATPRYLETLECMLLNAPIN